MVSLKYKKLISLAIAIALVLALSVAALAADTSQSYDFRLRAGGQEALTVEPGETFDVTVELSRTDESVRDFTMYAATYVLWYDAEFFELDEGSITFGQTDDRGVLYIENTDVGRDGWKGITVSVKSPTFEGAEWTNPSTLLSFNIKAETIGASAIQCRSAAMSTIYGGAYSEEHNNVIVTVEKPESNTSSGSTTPTTPTTPTPPPKPTTPEVKQPLYADVPVGSWYEDAVKYVTDAGLFNGVGDNKFDPDGTMNRAMFVTVLHRYAKLPAAKAAADFTDVRTGQWYSEAIAWASENGIVNGYGDGVFGLIDDITLEQMITVIYRYCGVSAKGSVPTAYGAVSDWAEDAMSWASAAGLFDGVGGTLTAGKPASRAQVAAFMANLNELDIK